MEIASYCQPPVSASTPATIWLGVILGPDVNLMRVRRPVAVTLTCVPPTSMTRIFIKRLPRLLTEVIQSATASFSWRIGEGGGKLLERIAKLFRVKVGNRLRE